MAHTHESDAWHHIHTGVSVGVFFWPFCDHRTHDPVNTQPFTWFKSGRSTSVKSRRNRRRTCMINRMHDVLRRFSRTARQNRRERKMHQDMVASVDTNAGGTTGYTVKQGPNKGKILKHLTVKHPNSSV